MVDRFDVEHSDGCKRKVRVEEEKKEVPVEAFAKPEAKNLSVKEGRRVGVWKGRQSDRGCLCLTFSIAKAFVQLPKHRNVVGSEVNLSCLPEAMLRLILLYALELFSKMCDID